MKVVRDESWHVLYKDALTSGRDDKVCITMANSIWRYNVKSRQMKEARSKRTVVIVDDRKKSEAVRKQQSCQGSTKSGEPCRFMASCNGFCKKHFSM